MAASKAAPTAPPKAPVKLDPSLLQLKQRDPAYTLDPKGKRCEVSPGTYVARGVRVNGATPSLVFVDGSRQSGIPFAVIAHAILGGVITDAEIDAIRAQRA